MKQNLLKISVLMLALIMALAFVGCSKSEEASDVSEEAEGAIEEAVEEEADETAELFGNLYGYSGTDAAELAAYKYMIDEIAKTYGDADVSIPVVTIVDKDDSNPDDVLVKGNFQIYNYNIEGDTLKCVSGGDHPGCMHMKKGDDGTYAVTSFDPVLDGGEYESSAKEIFGDKYDKFMEVVNDTDALNAARLEAVTVYVNANEIPCTKYQDEGWEPVDLHL